MTDNRTSDTRKKLEADVQAFTERWGRYGGYYMRVYGSVAYVQIIGLLDRQAAITERHWMEIVGASASANIELKRQIDELQGELQGERETSLAKANDGTLTAKQVSKATYAHSIHADCADADWQAIADELNAELVSGTCEPNWVLQGKTQTQKFWRCECGNCGHEFGVETRESFPFKMTIGKVEVPNFCPNCGAMVKKGE